MKKFVKSTNPVIRVMIGSITGIFIAITLTLLSAAFIAKNDISKDLFKYFWFVIFAISCLLSSMISVAFLKSKKLLWTALTTSIIIAIIILTLAIASNFSLNLNVLINVPVGYVFGIIGTMLIANKY